MYFVRTPFFAKKIYSQIIWDLPNAGNKLYITFDDGPHPVITPWVLAELRKYNAKATFFCVGQQATKYPEIIAQIMEEGHAIGSHSNTHINGWKTANSMYVQDVHAGIRAVPSFGNSRHLFRPPYGKIKKAQIRLLDPTIQIVNWSLMPGDFDASITSEQCYKHVTKRVKSGDIICLHDNEKAQTHLRHCLPKWLDFFAEQQYILEKINSDCLKR